MISFPEVRSSTVVCSCRVLSSSACHSSICFAEEEFFLGLINKSHFENVEMTSYCGAVDDVNDEEELRPPTMQDPCPLESVEAVPALNNVQAKT